MWKEWLTSPGLPWWPQVPWWAIFLGSFSIGALLGLAVRKLRGNERTRGDVQRGV